MDIIVSARRRIDAPADRIYHYIADFEHHHSRFLPHQFSTLEIEEGGYGAGTLHRVSVTLGGKATEYRVRVREPEPGRVITETDPSRHMVTTFTVDPDGAGSRVTIETRWRTPGLKGLVERLVAPSMLRRVYVEELELLARYAGARAFMRTMVPEPPFPA